MLIRLSQISAFEIPTCGTPCGRFAAQHPLCKVEENPKKLAPHLRCKRRERHRPGIKALARGTIGDNDLKDFKNKMLVGAVCPTKPCSIRIGFKFGAEDSSAASSFRLASMTSGCTPLSRITIRSPGRNSPAGRSPFAVKIIVSCAKHTTPVLSDLKLCRLAF